MPQSRTLWFEYPRSAFICSRALPVRKHEAPHTKGSFPPFASPAPMPIIFCSAIPTFTNRVGNRLRKFPNFEEPTESLTTATILGSRSACSSSVLTNSSLQSKRSVTAQLLDRCFQFFSRRNLVVPFGPVCHE